MRDEEGNVLWQARYDALGRVARLKGSYLFDNPIRLQGQYYDEELELCYNRYRYFDPQICSFISKDPLGLAAGENLYSYAPNVWGWVDPLGLCKGIPKLNVGDKVYRVYGDDARPDGASWTTINPNTVPDYRNSAGLPSGGPSGANNTGRFVIEGSVLDPSKVILERKALPLDGMAGGVNEYIIPDPFKSGAIKIDRVCGVNPEF